jgi:hypothetical protein
VNTHDRDVKSCVAHGVPPSKAGATEGIRRDIGGNCSELAAMPGAFRPRCRFARLSDNPKMLTIVSRLPANRCPPVRLSERRGRADGATRVETLDDDASMTRRF